MDDRNRPDPVQWAADEGTDLYDVVTWEERSRLDSVSRSVYGALVASSRAMVVSVALLIVLSQAALTVAALQRDPIVGAYIVASIVPALVIAFYVWRSDVTMAQPLDSLAITFLLGILFASFAAVANSSLEGTFAAFGSIGLVLFFYLVVAPVEETVKLLAVRMYGYRQTEFAAVVDGAVYGAVAGLGFAAIENTLYITQQYFQTAAIGGETPLVATLQTAAVRTFAGPGHVIYSAIAGYYLGLAKFNPANRGPIVVKGLLIAAFIHGTYNVLVSNLGTGLAVLSPVVAIPPAIGFIAFVVVFDAVVLFALVVKLRSYARAFRETGAAAFYGRFDGSTADAAAATGGGTSTEGSTAGEQSSREGSSAGEPTAIDRSIVGEPRSIESERASEPPSTDESD
ncbi:Membrane proteinase of CAAX superfamily, regulator of anti-sigma factor [Halanaeroarchaeum sp. HSR-CO]|uniref:PrsW family intramembrane metalloprotease n=1 Tax=Halanaeroarchaeum sp. HSR-CO TaxID=2866382 RepID=UPI00217D4384|nr:PrsW family intramembrane metalloprotease [Halanaeroarchaeum sp. HSR-CO]UWG46917.1 Membrane proteinase of CAAX superfamily, regulator of anti-sigma factor [Halanaeroarchaeum sp. HSR-CO]